MRRPEVIAELVRARPDLSVLGVSALYLFGSVARDEAGPGSDIDLLVDSTDPTFSIFGLAKVRAALVQLLPAPVEVHDFGGFKRLPAFRQRVEAELIRVF